MKTTLMRGMAALAFMASALPAAAQNIEFKIINDSSVDLHFFFASPSSQESWGEDLLAEIGVLESGYEGTTLIGDASDQCLYDFLFQGPSGEELVATEIDICNLESYTLTD